MQFLQAWCEYGQGYEISSARLYDAYHLWAKENAYEPYTKTFFGRKVGEDSKVKKSRGADRIYYHGIQLTFDADAALINSTSYRKPREDGGEAAA
jgi:phage/plasmid-associated DNA primase